MRRWAASSSSAWIADARGAALRHRPPRGRDCRPSLADPRRSCSRRLARSAGPGPISARAWWSSVRLLTEAIQFFPQPLVIQHRSSFQHIFLPLEVVLYREPSAEIPCLCQFLSAAKNVCTTLFLGHGVCLRGGDAPYHGLTPGPTPPHARPANRRGTRPLSLVARGIEQPVSGRGTSPRLANRRDHMNPMSVCRARHLPGRRQPEPGRVPCMLSKWFSWLFLHPQ